MKDMIEYTKRIFSRCDTRSREAFSMRTFQVTAPAKDFHVCLRHVGHEETIQINKLYSMLIKVVTKRIKEAFKSLQGFTFKKQS